jgi:Arc/MetJ-type ribon-helix-helix transcriptional regulator
VPLQLTSEQEQRIRAIVDTGAYRSAEESLNAAVVALATAAAPNFEGSDEELEILLRHGLATQELSEEQFWNSVDCETNELLDVHRPKPRA